MNPLSYVENILFSAPNTFFSMIFRRKWILSLISKYSLFCFETILFYDIFDIIESSHLFRKHSRSCSDMFFSVIFRHKWILSLMSKCLLFLFSYSIFPMIFRVSESSHLFRDICFLLSVHFFVLYYFDINESSHLYRDIHLFPLPRFFV